MVWVDRRSGICVYIYITGRCEGCGVGGYSPGICVYIYITGRCEGCGVGGYSPGICVYIYITGRYEGCGVGGQEVRYMCIYLHYREV